MRVIGRLCGAMVLFIAGLLVPSISASQPVVFPKGCVDCHGSESKYPVRGIRTRYLTSGHRTIGNASYANADDCQRCHTNEGFIGRTRREPGFCRR
jgi:hypothetical protein